MTARPGHQPGTSADLARLLLRVYLGAELIAHRACPRDEDQQGHSPAPAAPATSSEPTGPLAAVLAGHGQHLITTAAAVALITGAATPLAAAVSTAFGCAIPAIHHPNGLGSTSTTTAPTTLTAQPSTSLTTPLATALVTTVAAITIAALGPGRWSLDHILTRPRSRSRPRSGRRAMAAGLTAAAALAQLARSWPAPDTR